MQTPLSIWKGQGPGHLQAKLDQANWPRQTGGFLMHQQKELQGPVKSQ
jgi:hypothetical protein